MTFDTSTPMNPQGRLAGKTVFITGAGSVGPGWGNGRAMALRFAQEGANVYGVDRDAERLVETRAMIEQIGGSFVAGTCDVTSSASIEQAISACHERFGRLDVLVNNVGGSAKGGPVEMSEEVWDAQVDHNLKSVFLTCKHALPLMLAQGSGNIINIASTSGIRWTGSAQIAYAATKAGVIQLSRVLAVQYAKQSIRVNTVVPGQLHTPMVEIRLAGQRAGGDVQALLEQRQSRIPLPFMGDGRDTANAALYLASDESRFVTGTEIIVDGGMSVRCD
ncbi:MAG: SDR family NAD(P)-dependent oxidoreductase [Comamonas sp.]|uniref:SDR family NAD(P)-dependent oxidoreductase n=1 Tax=Acidovorax sp. CCYZU-2555 TaxID=2835042 RepID=UPI001BD09F91|nr:SDR family NAD(P)-dependent oxidoreductase [Acidovorax sp. CCYZU-2555]MBS7778905.1 SDR family oxidoreductase [Acidovorax sp. CCYZU-2555]